MVPDNFRYLTFDQKKCAVVLCKLFRGWHHVPPIHKHGTGIHVNPFTHYMATFDMDYLTRAVILAHRHRVRIALGHSSPGRVKLILHKRKRQGGISKRHPGVERLQNSHKKRG